MLLEVWRDEDVVEIGEFAEYFEDTWVNSDLCNWHEGTTTNCANTNGLESTNKRIKADFLTRTMQSFEPFLQDVGAILNYWSIHLRDLPNVPDIPLAEMKKALELVAECTAPTGGEPRRYHLRLAGTSTYVFASSEARFANVGELFEAYQRSFVAGPSSWEEYAEWRFEVHRVYPSTKFNGPFYECSCQKGCKKNVCKHVVMVMCTLEKIYEYSAEALAKPMKHSRRSNAKQTGRPTLSQKQNRFAAAD
ncbi:hypothetical protein AAVH_20442 [Aphelenchoides avenae]|nr:hypothetical protein AAVH_20442 [Aphelenchus avenae]